MKEHVEVELLALQGDLPLDANDPGTSPGVKTTTHRIEYPRQVEIPGAEKPKKKLAKKRKGRR